MAANPWEVVGEEPFSGNSSGGEWDVVDESPSEAQAAEKQPEHGTLSNLARGVGERMGALAGGVLTSAAKAGRAVARHGVPVGPLGVMDLAMSVGDRVLGRAPQPRAGLMPLPEAVRKPIEAGADLLEGVGGEMVQGGQLGYEPMTTPEDVKDAWKQGNYLKAAREAVEFGLEQGIVSLPDMAAAVGAFPAYTAARAGEIAQNRAQVDGRDKITDRDYAIGAATAAVSAAMERFGAERVLHMLKVGGKNALTRILSAAGSEAATEAGQEATEYVGERIGQKPIVASEMGERAAFGALGGFVGGGAIRSTVEAGSRALGPPGDQMGTASGIEAFVGPSVGRTDDDAQARAGEPTEEELQATVDRFGPAAPTLQEQPALPAPRPQADFEVNSAGYAAPSGQAQPLLSQGEEGTTDTLRVNREGVARPETHLERSESEQAAQRWRETGLDEVAGANQGRGRISRERSASLDSFTDQAGQRHEIRPLTEATFEEFIRPVLRDDGPQSFQEYVEHYPHATSVRVAYRDGRAAVEHVADEGSVRSGAAALRARPGAAISEPAHSRRSVDPRNDSVLTAIAKLGGLTRDEAEHSGIEPKHFRHLGFGIDMTFRRAGKSFAAMAEALGEMGYPVTGPVELGSLVQRELSGTPVFAVPPVRPGSTQASTQAAPALSAAMASGAGVVSSERPVRRQKRPLNVSKNRLFTDEAAEKAREVLRRKLSQLNAGPDPETLNAGIVLAGYHFERGARTFAAFSKAMVDDLGDAVRPYLRGWYEHARRRDYPDDVGDHEGASPSSDVERDNRSDDADTARPRRDLPADDSSESGPTWSAPDSTRLDDVIYTIQDKHIDLKRVQQAIKKATSVDQLADDVDAYLKEELFHGRVATRLQRFLDDELKPFLKQLSLSGIPLDELEQYLWARFARERNAAIARINPKMPDGGSGLTNQAAANYLDALPADKRKRLEQLAKAIDAITEKTRDTLVGYGLEPQATVDAWREQSPHYVPLYREGMEEDFSGKPQQGFSVRGPSTKSALGSSKRVVHILANIAIQRERAIVRGEKNRVANALLGLARLNPNPRFWTVDQRKRVRYLHPRAERMVETDDPQHKNRQNVVTVRTVGLDGNVFERTITFNPHDERAMRMAKSIKSLDVDDLGRFLSISGKVTRYFASISTQYNPFFGFVNIYRDVKAALLNLTSTPLNGAQAKILGDTFSAMRGIWVDARVARKGKHPASSWARLWEEFQDVGGQTGYRDMFRTSNDRAEAIQSELRQMAAGKGLLAFHALRDLVSDFNLTMENAVRLATYKAGKDAGLSTERAASIAKNISVNFNRKGSKSNKIGALYMFFNANAQGNARTIETLAGPKGKQIIAGGLFLGVLQALLLDAFDYDDDDPPAFVRERNLVIPLPGTDKRYLLSPYPLGYHVLPSIGRVAAELWIDGGVKKAPKKVTELLSIMVEAFNPLGSAGWSMQTVLPTALDPLAALAENKDWTGKPIARKDFSDQNPTPGHTRAKASASDFSRATSRIINSLTGGTEYVASDFWSPTPDQIDYLIGQATGGVGREAKKTWDTAASLLSGEMPPAYKVPLFGRFYGSADSEASYGNRFYDLVRRSNNHKRELEGRAHDGGDVEGYWDANPEVRLIDAVSKTAAEVSKMRRGQGEMEKAGYSKADLKQIDAAITAKMRAAVEAERQIREQ